MVTREAVDILLVDDQQSRLLTYEAILGPLGHRLVTASSGVEALQRLMEREFAVILLDVSMPGMDGFETARLIHDHPRFEGTPIIFVTGVHVSELDRLKGYRLGAVDYVYVPVVPEILRSKVAVLVELHSQRMELQRLNASLSQANAELDAANQELQREKARELANLNRSLEEANRELAAGNEKLMREIAERRRAQQELLEADHRKDDFLAILGHELRNPLAPIRIAIAILQRHGPDDPALVRMRDLIDRQVQHMTRLIDDLLDVSRITQGKINLKPAPLDVGVVARQALETSMPMINTRKHQVVVSIPDEPLHVNGDTVRIAQVIGNLVSNAAKYTPDGGRIELQLGSADGFVTIAVRDNGIGIAQEYLSHVFDLFGQVRNPRPHTHEGLGIGLALVQRIVEMHRGQVEARSAGENLGSEFVVRLPLLEPSAGAADDPAVRPPAAAGLSGRRILVVDDSEDCRDSLATMLQLDGNEVRTAADGAAALEVAASFEPEIVLLDIRMPVMDGYEAARRLRAEPHGKDVVLIALTGWGQQEHRERSRLAGFDAHLTKPLDHGELSRLIMSLTHREQPASVTAA
ncbi:MAG TPA: response regulator [Steroidobacteraceae bacterium]